MLSNKWIGQEWLWCRAVGGYGCGHAVVRERCGRVSDVHFERKYEFMSPGPW